MFYDSQTDTVFQRDIIRNEDIELIKPWDLQTKQLVRRKFQSLYDS